MIKAGSSFFHNGKRCTTGAIILLKGLPYMPILEAASVIIAPFNIGIVCFTLAAMEFIR